MFASGSDLKGRIGFFHLPSLVSHAEVLIQVTQDETILHSCFDQCPLRRKPCVFESYR